jgi:hypothetical protein
VDRTLNALNLETFSPDYLRVKESATRTGQPRVTGTAPAGLCQPRPTSAAF